MRLVEYRAGNERVGVLTEARNIKLELEIGGGSALEFTIPGLWSTGDGNAVTPTHGRWLFQLKDIAVEFCWGGAWVEPANCRFQIIKEDFDPDTRETVLSGRSVAYDLQGGVNASGLHRDKETWGHKYTNRTPGFIVKHYIDSAKSLRTATHVDYGFTAAADSTGAAWPRTTTQSLDFNATIMDAIDACDDLVDWEMRGNTLFMTRKGGLFEDHLDINLVLGADLKGLPRKRNVDEAAQVIIAKGEKGLMTVVSNTEWGTTRGPRAVTRQYSGVDTLAELQRKANADLAEMNAISTELSRDIDLRAATFTPIRDYQLGDVVGIQTGTEGQIERLQLTALTVMYDDDESGLQMTAWFGDRVAALQRRMSRKIKAVTGSVQFGGVQAPIKDAAPQHMPPAAPSGVSAVTSIVYDDGGWGQAKAAVSWTAPTEDTAGNDLAWEPDGYHVEYSVGGGAWMLTTTTGLSVDLEGLEPALQLRVRVRGVNRMGEGRWSGVVTATLPPDLVPPPEARGLSLSSDMGVVFVKWDGTLAGPVPRDFDRVDLVVSGETVGSVRSAGEEVVVTGLQPKSWVTLYGKSRDRSGNLAAAWTPGAHQVASVLDNVDISGALDDVQAEIDAAWDRAGDALTEAGEARGDAEAATLAAGAAQSAASAAQQAADAAGADASAAHALAGQAQAKADSAEVLAQAAQDAIGDDESGLLALRAEADAQGAELSAQQALVAAAAALAEKAEQDAAAAAGVGQAAQNSIDNLQIGGRNLIPRFTDPRWELWSNSETPDAYTLFNAGERRQSTNGQIILPVAPHTDYTLTVNSDRGRANLYGWLPDLETTGDAIFNFITGTFSRTINTGENSHVRLTLGRFSQELEDITFWNIKFEKGNKATDWTPAPEDQAAATAAAQAAADAAAADATAKAAAAEQAAKDHADAVAEAERLAAIAAASDDATAKANAAEAAAAATAAADAEAKANAALEAAKLDATAKADAATAVANSAVSAAAAAQSAADAAAADAESKAAAAEQAAKDHADAQAAAAEAAAIAAASGDASDKAAAAQAAAEATAAADAQAKADAALTAAQLDATAKANAATAIANAAQSAAATAQSAADTAQAAADAAAADAIAKAAAAEQAAKDHADAQAAAAEAAAIAAAAGDASSKAAAAEAAAIAAAATDALAQANAALEAAKLDATAKANAAAAIANSKADVLIQSTTPPAAMRKDTTLWIDTTGGNNTPKRWRATPTPGAWVEVTDKAAKDAAAAAAATQVELEQAKLDIIAAKQAADDADAKALAAVSAVNAVSGQVSTINGKMTISPVHPNVGNGLGKPHGSIWEVTNPSGTTTVARYMWHASVEQWEPIRVGQNFIGEEAIGRAQIAEAAVGTAQIGNAQVTDAKIGTLSVGKLRAGSAEFDLGVINKLVGTEAFISQLTAEKLMIGDRSNLIDNPVPNSASGWSPLFTYNSGAGHVYRTAATSGVELSGNSFPLREGQRIGVAVDARATSAARTFSVFLVEVDESGNEVSGGSSLYAVPYGPAGTQSAFVTRRGEVDVVKTGLYRLGFEVGGSSGWLYLKNFAVGSVMHGTLIQDGTVTTDALLVKQGWIESLVTSSLVADRITAGSLDGYVFTGHLIRTAASGARVQLDSTGLRAYNSSGSVTASILGGSGAIDGFTVTGGTIRTASSGSRVQMDASTNSLRAYSGSTLRARLNGDALTFYGTTGLQRGSLSGSDLGGGRLQLSAPGSVQVDATGGVDLAGGTVSIIPSGTARLSSMSGNVVIESENGKVTLNGRDIGTDTGWQTLTLSASWNHVASWNVFVRKVNGTVFIKGLASLVSGHNAQNAIATLPAQYRPTGQSFYLQASVASGNKETVTPHVASTGGIALSASRWTGAPTGYIGLTGSWPAAS